MNARTPRTEKLATDATRTRPSFLPDFSVAPGVTLAETLAVKGMTHSELSVRTGIAEQTIKRIVDGTAPIMYDTAEKLEVVLGIPSRFWNNLERNYQEAQARIE